MRLLWQNTWLFLLRLQPKCILKLFSNTAQIQLFEWSDEYNRSTPIFEIKLRCPSNTADILLCFRLICQIRRAWSGRLFLCLGSFAGNFVLLHLGELLLGSLLAWAWRGQIAATKMLKSAVRLAWGFDLFWKCFLVQSCGGWMLAFEFTLQLLI